MHHYIKNKHFLLHINMCIKSILTLLYVIVYCTYFIQMENCVLFITESI